MVHFTFPKVNDPDCLQMQADIAAQTCGADEPVTNYHVLPRVTKYIYGLWKLTFLVG